MLAQVLGKCEGTARDLCLSCRKFSNLRSYIVNEQPIDFIRYGLRVMCSLKTAKILDTIDPPTKASTQHLRQQFWLLCI